MIKKIFISLGFLFVFEPTLCQKKIDSLRTSIKDKKGIHKYEPIIGLTREYASINDNRSALEFAKESYQIAYQAQDSSKIANSSRMIGMLLLRLNEPKQTEQFLLQALTAVDGKKFKSDYLSMKSVLALAYTYQAKYDKALDINFQVLTQHKEDNNNEGESIALNNIGLVYYKLKDYDKALIYFKQCLDVTNTLADKFFIDRLLINISLCYAYTNRFDDAKKYVDEALETCDNCSDNFLIEVNHSLGVIFFGLEELIKAESYFRKSYELAKRTNYSRLQFDNIVYLSTIGIQQNRTVKAIKYLSEVEELVKKGGQFNLELVKIYPVFFQHFIMNRDFERAVIYQQKYIQLRDSIFSEELTTNLMRIEADYSEKENQAKIASQNQIILLNEEIIRRQNLLNASISAVGIVLVILAIVLFKSNKQRKMINHFLESRVKERTVELELNRNELLRACNERDLMIERIAQAIRSSMASIKGICEVGLKDISEPGARVYLHKVEETSSLLSASINNLSRVQERTLSLKEEIDHSL